MPTPSSMLNTFAVTVDASAGRPADDARPTRRASLDVSSAVHQDHSRYRGRAGPGARGAADESTVFQDDNPVFHFPRAAPHHRRQSLMPMLDTSVSPYSSAISPSPSSASLSSPASANSTASEADDAWNLVPYHVSWGHEYEEYRAGTLPGPHGECIFLRSPTPLKNQRASEACKKCRERKAKCSGTRPSCARCSQRGHQCEYASEVIVEGGDAVKPPRVHHDGALTSASAPPRAIKRYFPNRNVFVKDEDPDAMVGMQYLEQPRTPSAYWEGSTPSDDFSMEEPWQFSELAAGDSDTFGQMHPCDGTDRAAVHSFIHSPSILAPQPVRHTSVPDLTGPATADSPSSYPLSPYVPIQPPVLPVFQNLSDTSSYAHVSPSPDFKVEPDYGLPLSYLS
ncbi:hypothetical protein FA95DRAFT_109350 [Auriscalpium vulgare]|uniref:Uncharacterized protein n=1 Tax=Auriscalpium vulgare TaxID=40419 RepID=A0ACB8S697_9AGAM|nr:hypothetical protein FA95DRAFT_109350 [Auriscalpium vulgare]